METKVCSKCKVCKNICGFSRDKSRTDGLYPSCKECEKKRFKLYRIENKEKLKEKYKKDKEKNPNYIKDWHKKNPKYNSEYEKKRRSIYKFYILQQINRTTTTKINS